MIIIAPSLLSANFLNLQEDISKLENIPGLWLHLDIMDSHFVPNLTFGEPVLNKIQHIFKQPLDAHFMVTNPDFYIDNFKDCGLTNFTFHYESTKDHLNLIKKIKKQYPSCGISIKPKTDVNLLTLEILQNVDLVLVMSVEPGFGGQKFMPESLEKIKSLVEFKSKNNLHFQIQIDGGINSETAKLALSAGATNLVAGSYIFNEPNKNFHERINNLR